MRYSFHLVRRLASTTEAIRRVSFCVSMTGLMRLLFGQVPEPPCTITISVPHSSFKVGSKVQFTVVLKNISDHDLGVAAGLGNDYEVLLFRSDGKAGEKTQWYRRMRGEDPAAISGPITVAGSGLLKPGATYQQEFTLNDLYELSQPHKYTLHVKWMDFKTKVVAKSNAVTFTIEP